MPLLRSLLSIFNSACLFLFLGYIFLSGWEKLSFKSCYWGLWFRRIICYFTKLIEKKSLKKWVNKSKSTFTAVLGNWILKKRFTILPISLCTNFDTIKADINLFRTIVLALSNLVLECLQRHLFQVRWFTNYFLNHFWLILRLSIW